MKMTTQQMVMVGLFAALTFVATYLIKIPSGFGYIHPGDSIVYLSGIMLGPIFGALAAGIGSFLADILAGYASYALPTLIIKALDALVVALVFKALVKDEESVLVKSMKFIIAAVCGGLIMVSGYFAFEYFVYPEYAFVDILPNVIQASGAIVIAWPLYLALKNVKLIK